MHLILFFLLLFKHTLADCPAFKVALSEKGLTDVSQLMSVWIVNTLKTIELPEFHGELDIKIGTIDFTLSNMWIVQCSMSEPSLVFVKGTGVSVTVTQLSLAITGSWATHFGIIHDGGTFDLAVNNINMNTLLQLGDDDAGHLSVSSVTCSDDVGGVQIQFHGGASILFQLFVSEFSGHISDVLRQKICQATEQAIVDLERHLQEFSVNIRVDQYIYMNIPLTSSPSVTDNSIELDMKGEFYSSSSPSEPPFSPSSFDMQPAENYMLSLAASDFFVNSAAYAYFSSGLLQINIRDDMIPKSSPIHLNTSQFGIFIPQLRTLYPDMEMHVLLYASETPLFSFSSAEVDVHVTAAAKFSAVKHDSTLIPLFRVDVDSSFNGNAQIDNIHLTAALKINNLTLTLGSSEIGDFNTGPLEKLLKMAMSTVVLPKLNAYLKIGVPLPTLHGFSFSNAEMFLRNGFVLIVTDVEAPHDIASGL
ncbi:bactericidal permeability-increasing protein isoform X1 [Myxocyprinus asiaticus]|uniref:bactericidal permeability-increasing protein isoform X1 n=2 Tax=Myxocyprinus asiaticus TaxID=70543 RepID=UPI0022225253|nr:bactericidal permeability-increasing protein isoform X1 [Myxocyprinus asiaticus]